MRHAVDHSVTSNSTASAAKPKKKKDEQVKASCHRILYTPATQSVSSIGATINKTPHRFTFSGHEISVSADVPVKLNLMDRKILDFILILLTKYLPIAGPWADVWVSFTLADILHRFGIDQRNHRDSKGARVSRTYFDRICRALDKLALLRLRQDGGPEFSLVESYRLAKRDGEALKKDVVAGRGCFIVQIPQSLLDHLTECGTGRNGKLRIVPFLDSLFYGVSDNAYAIVKRMMAHYHFDTNGNATNRNRLRIRTLTECCPALEAKLPADRRRTFDKTLLSLILPADACDAIIPCRYASNRPLVAHEDWLNAVIEFEPYEIEYIPKDDLDMAHALFPNVGGQQTHDIEDPVDEQQFESVASAAEGIVTPEDIDEWMVEPEEEPTVIPLASTMPTARPHTSPGLRPSASPADPGAQWNIQIPGLASGG